ncbi:MAG TPA: MBL fold metallo-hydrolase [Mucilaginibacter sp.]|jgi:glyoxylase-like metal-dependent hydrolase (beta-lactamase superfamily II)|nr:MBL fold metallo-hydrolase [Mucilaginibacter sp.]
MLNKIFTIQLFILFFCEDLFPQSVVTANREVVKLAENVYMVRHKDAPDGNPQGNTTIIIGAKKVIVVDACYLPSAAREDIAFIKTLTSKPVDYLINTHWHADHQQGNTAYANAFPHITIIAHEETAKEMIAFEKKDLNRYGQGLDSLKKQIKTGKSDDGKAFTSSELADMKQLSAEEDSVETELVNYLPTYPNMTISGDINLDIGNEVVQILYLGPVHTRGDILVFLPIEKILITGDVLACPIPYFFGGGYPYTGVKVLEAINQMDFKCIVPGHGELLNDKIYLNQVIDLLKSAISLVEAEVYKEGLLGIKLENVQKAVDLSAFKKQFAKGNKDNEYYFDESIAKGLVEGCFNGMAK